MSVSIMIVGAFAALGILTGAVKALIYILPNKEGREWLRNGEYSCADTSSCTRTTAARSAPWSA